MKMSLLQRLKRTLQPPKQRLPHVLRAVQMLLVEQQTRDVDRDRDLDWEYEHIEQAVTYAKMLAVRRKLDPDFAACAAAAQNIGRIVFGKSEGHAETGYELARRLYAAVGCFTPVEVEQLAASVRNHSHKDKVDSPLDELGKDVDVYVRYVQGHEFTAPHELRRLSAIRLELQRKVL